MAADVSAKPSNPKEIKEFHEKVMQDIAALAGIACSAIGDKLGLYRIMAESEPMTAAELAAKSHLTERYVREWLVNQAAGDYVKYDPSSGRFSLPAAHAAVLADESSIYFAGGAMQMFCALARAVPQIAECFKSGEGMSWSDHDPDVFEGTRRLFGPVYVHLLVKAFIPAVAGLREKLESGTAVADIGCGHGISTLTMASAFPQSNFCGFDNHPPSIAHATSVAAEQKLADRVEFKVSSAYDFPGTKYGVVAFFDSLHDLGDPVAACRRAAELLEDDGYLLIVEPQGGNTVEENFNVPGRTLSGASVLCCTPNAIAGGKHALGTIASDAELAKVVNAGGFKTFRRVYETAFNRVFEARLS